MGRELIIAGSAEILDELCDEKRFWKTPSDGVASLSKGDDKPKGLFAAHSEDSMDWQQAHRTLMPAFGPMNIALMADEMHDIASQLVLKWARMGSSYRIPVTADFTRLTLDTIALCAMDYRFNSFYQDEIHPFVAAMNNTLGASSDRLKVGSILRKMLPWDRSAEKVKQDGNYIMQLAKELVQIRRNNPTEKRDLLNAMVNNADPKTGEMMSDDLISANMITFLIAGHETTSGLLSFGFLNLLKNPEAYFRVQQEVDKVVGRGKISVKHLKDLKYIDAVLRETLRLAPTAPAFTRSIRRDNSRDVEELSGGKYAIKRSDRVLCLLSKAQRDPKVYGEDANDFRPERMLDENFAKLPPGAWKPFGTGVRACIGRPFAWQEAQMCMALIMQNFNLRLDDPSYEMKIKQTLTIKPEGFFMRATLRDGITATSLQDMLTSSGSVVEATVQEGLQRTETLPIDGSLKPMTILYGSNTGTCMSLSQTLGKEARRHGFQASILEMDAAVENFPKDQPIVVITASYEGQPPDNAGQFVKWLETLEKGGQLQSGRYAVFGCGHADWVNTFQRIPKLVDNLLEEHGCQRIAPRGSADASQGDIFGDFDSWTEQVLWPSLAPDGPKDTSMSSALDIEMSTQNRTSYLRQDVQVASVISARQLTADGEPEKRHLEIQLPEGMIYETGDYLAILPLNPQASVTRTMKHFNITSDATMTIKPGNATYLPTDVTFTVVDLLKGFVELSSPVTKKDVQSCIQLCRDTKEADQMRTFLDKEGFAGLTEQHMSLLDLLTKYSSIEMPFATFLSMLPPLRPRHYSISSSPLVDPKVCTITYGIINEAAKSGLGHYVGVTSSYLSGLKAGDEVSVSVRATNKYFHLPADTATPLLMFGAGTGLAPFRGFIQERAQQVAAGRKVAPAVMFMGCRSATRDRLYADEMDAWSKAGVVDVRYAFSREPEKSEGCRYIQDRFIKDREDVLRMWKDGAKVFTCGGPKVSEQVGIAAQQLLIDAHLAEKGEKMSKADAEAWFRERRNERFVVDVFA